MSGRPASVTIACSFARDTLRCDIVAAIKALAAAVPSDESIDMYSAQARFSLGEMSFVTNDGMWKCSK